MVVSVLGLLLVDLILWQVLLDGMDEVGTLLVEKGRVVVTIRGVLANLHACRRILVREEEDSGCGQANKDEENGTKHRDCDVRYEEAWEGEEWLDSGSL